MIRIEQMNYDYKTFEKQSGLVGSLKDFFFRKEKISPALRDLQLTIEEGEFIGLLGANGAGKTTLIKLMTGILSPTSGEIFCGEFIPHQRQKDYLRQIGVVLGQKSQLIWDLPAKETLELLKVIYNIEQKQYEKRVAMMCGLLEVEHKLHTPVRKLSLGERIKFEIICSLLHSPRVLFLDEPTIGLDITSQQKIRQFLKEINQRDRVTIILTSHYMQDIESLCQRVVVLAKGRIIDDLPIDVMKKKYNQGANVLIQFKETIPAALTIYQTGERSVLLSEEEYEAVCTNLELQEIESLYKQEKTFEEIVFDLFEESRK